jgi:hypothetical protein
MCVLDCMGPSSTQYGELSHHHRLDDAGSSISSHKGASSVNKMVWFDKCLRSVSGEMCMIYQQSQHEPAARRVEDFVEVWSIRPSAPVYPNNRVIVGIKQYCA